ncbi:hypothetical protein NVP2275O_158 [Vibrio phage 2.275.O._10N.286.54.E11]|nr:hypothetical protein NVP2275O_158 [Vibrio phage 2.275.O._10N.286.54.E11]
MKIQTEDDIARVACTDSQVVCDFGIAVFGKKHTWYFYKKIQCLLRGEYHKYKLMEKKGYRVRARRHYRMIKIRPQWESAASSEAIYCLKKVKPNQRRRGIG